MIVTARQKRKSRATGHGRKMKMGLRETLGSCQTHSPCESQNSPWENNDKWHSRCLFTASYTKGTCAPAPSTRAKITGQPIREKAGWRVMHGRLRQRESHCIMVCRGFGGMGAPSNFLRHSSSPPLQQVSGSPGPDRSCLFARAPLWAWASPWERKKRALGKGNSTRTVSVW